MIFVQHSFIVISFSLIPYKYKIVLNKHLDNYNYYCLYTNRSWSHDLYSCCMVSLTVRTTMNVCRLCRVDLDMNKKNRHSLSRSVAAERSKGIFLIQLKVLQKCLSLRRMPSKHTFALVLGLNILNWRQLLIFVSSTPIPVAIFTTALTQYTSQFHRYNNNNNISN